MKIFTRSPEGGCVTVAVTRQEPSDGSRAAESMVVLGIATFVKLSHGQIGFASGNSALGGESCFGALAGCALPEAIAAVNSAPATSVVRTEEWMVCITFYGREFYYCRMCMGGVIDPDGAVL